jgi:hypothetical protein
MPQTPARELRGCGRVFSIGTSSKPAAGQSSGGTFITGTGAAVFLCLAAPWCKPLISRARVNRRACNRLTNRPRC